jgi:hypothetical protein
MGLPVSPQDAFDAYSRVATEAPLAIRLLAGAAALAFLLAGVRLYRVAIVLPGVLAGVFIAASLPPTWEPGSKLIVGILVSMLGGLTLFFMEKVAIRVVGATLAGWLVWAVWPLAATTAAPWWALAAAAVVGLLIFPSIFPLAIQWITSALGALLGAWALGYPTNPLVILALAAVGIMYQSLTTRRGPDEEITG